MNGHCNRASIAAVTRPNPEPMKPCPGGTAARTDEQEVTSELDIQVTKTEIGREAERKVCVSDKPEEDVLTVTVARVTPGIEG
ncbi:hypothetical protein NDU88_008799 [Pleurodeles waltl]|uniref:Uncharacterized protein n=1 Tax=Pleurodeles waltl TaxID=8319 RepID=A0AAV7N9F9_PLEWA|nr:hypothetical protein NDU88_008799 [Pleurodeles waltl]